jgi:hypothetical protein
MVMVMVMVMVMMMVMVMAFVVGMAALTGSKRRGSMTIMSGCHCYGETV